jgi:hypothetical protein
LQGREYRIEAEDISKWPDRYADQYMRCTPDGPRKLKAKITTSMYRDAEFPLHPAHWVPKGAVKRLRVLEDRNGNRARFLTLIGCIGEDDSPENVFIIGSQAVITAHADGELVVFRTIGRGEKAKRGMTVFVNRRRTRIIESG